MRSWIIPAAVAFLCWGVWAFLPKFTVRFIDPRSAVVFAAVGGLLVAVISAMSLEFRVQIDPRGVALAVLTGVLGVGGGLAFLFAVRSGPTAVVVTVTALYPILAIVLAFLFLAEPITVRQWCGIFLGLVAMVLIAS